VTISGLSTESYPFLYILQQWVILSFFAASTARIYMFTMGRHLVAIATVLTSLTLTALGATLPAVTGRANAANPPGVVLVRDAKGPLVTPRPVARDIASPPQFVTISIINSHTNAISTAHAHDPNCPGAVQGNIGAGTIAKGSTASFAVPTGWVGNVALNDAAWPITGDDTLIEANFVVPDSYSIAIADVDVSYV
jgi:hypothetical protein